DDAGFDVIGERLLVVSYNRSSAVENFYEPGALIDVFEGAGVIFGGEEVIAILIENALANIFESVGISPTDADGFFGQGDGLSFLSVQFLLGQNPLDLVREKE